MHALRRRRRWRDPGPPAAWAQLRDDATDVGHPLQDAESPRQATARLASARRLGAPEREALDRVTHAVERARYARPGAAQPSAGLRDDVALVRRTLLAGVPRGRRVRARVLPPSTVAWAVTGVRGAWERVLGRVDELGPAVRRRLRPPGVGRPAGPPAGQALPTGRLSAPSDTPDLALRRYRRTSRRR